MSAGEQDKTSRTARVAMVASGGVLTVLGTALLIAISYAPDLLGIAEEPGAVVALTLRTFGFLALLGAGALILRARRKH